MNFLISVIPTIIILRYVYVRDIGKKEPLTLLIKLFLLGVALTFAAALLESIWLIQPGQKNLLQLFLFSFFNIALIEEGLKYFVFMRVIWNRVDVYDEVYDGIVYSVFISLGFATLENLLYVNMYGFQTGVIRAVTAVPLHAICAVIMGSYLSKAKFISFQWIDRIRGLIYPVMLHGLYNFIIFIDFPILNILVFPLLVLAYMRLGYRRVHALSGK